MNDPSIYAPIIKDYIDHGFSPIPIPFQSKAPILEGWTRLRITEDDYQAYFDGTPTNIGILTGEASEGLVDVDIDSIGALRFTGWFLPATNCVFGHKSKPKSHWEYLVPDAENLQVFHDTAGEMIVEVRGNGHCTVFPGSVHPSGEIIEFADPDDFRPAQATWDKLCRAATKIAIASVLRPVWNSGIRHRLTLATAATLARRGWQPDEVRGLIMAIATEANDDEIRDRLAVIEDTFAAFSAGRPISGDERLEDLVGRDQADRIRGWAAPQSKLITVDVPTSSPTPDLSNDSSAADAFASKFENDLIYCQKEWFRRKNCVFEPIAPKIVQGMAKEFLQSQKKKKLCARPRINAAVELSRSQFYVDPSDIDANRDVVGCKDGTVVDLATGQTVCGGGGYVTKKLGAAMNASADCPEWKRFLHRIFDADAELIKFIRRAVGYTLTGSVQEQCMFILIGTGANGKSTFLNTLHHLFGDYAATVPMAALMNHKNGSTQTNDLAYLVGKRFVAAAEGERNQRLAEAKIKSMTGGDRMVCRALYKDYFEFDPLFKLWLATNNLPNIIGMDEAIWRRIMVIPFPVTIPAEERDKELSARLLRELPGIFRWALDGLRDWQQQDGLNPPPSVIQSTRAYRQDNDTVGQWIDAACVLEVKSLISMKELYEAYKSWCENSGAEAMPNNCFGKELTRRGFEPIKGRTGNSRRGIALKPTADDEFLRAA